MARMSDIWPGIVCVVKRECKYGVDVFFFQRLAVMQRFVAAAQLLLFALEIDRGQSHNQSLATARRPLAAGGPSTPLSESTRRTLVVRREKVLGWRGGRELSGGDLIGSRLM